MAGVGRRRDAVAVGWLARMDTVTPGMVGVEVVVAVVVVVEEVVVVVFAVVAVMEEVIVIVVAVGAAGTPLAFSPPVQ